MTSCFLRNRRRVATCGTCGSTCGNMGHVVHVAVSKVIYMKQATARHWHDQEKIRGKNEHHRLNLLCVPNINVKENQILVILRFEYCKYNAAARCLN